MKLTADIAVKSLLKHGEELCGDKTEIVKSGEDTILILADGMGSGVKANILATLTSKILGTMFRFGADLEDCVRTVVRTLPVCQVRKAAYSTFSILKLNPNGEARLIEFDNPSCIIIRDGNLLSLPYQEFQIEGRTIRESQFSVEIGDMLLLMSDGVTYAGLGGQYPFGWTREGTATFAAEAAKHCTCAEEFISLLSEKCLTLYENRPGDDTTLLAARIVPAKILRLFWGPPENPEADEPLMQDFMSGEAIRVICGTTSAGIAARILGRVLTTNLIYTNGKYPPAAGLEGIDLVSEGTLTLTRTLELLKQALADISYSPELKSSDCGAKLACMMLKDCTEVEFFLGKRLSSIQRKYGLTFETSVRMTLIRQLSEVLEQLGRPVTLRCY